MLEIVTVWLPISVPHPTTRVMELNPNFIQHLDVESLLTLFVENFFSSLRGGNTDPPMMLDFCLRFPRNVSQERATGTLQIQWPRTTFSLL